MFKSSLIQSEIPPVLNLPPEFSPQIMEAAPSGMILIDIAQAGGPVVYVNTAFEKITGYSREDILGKSSSFLNQSDTGQAEVDQLRAAIHDRTACTVTLRVYRQDGTPFWSEIRISPLRDAQGTVTYYLVVLNDVIRRTRSEHYLQGVLDSSLNGIMAFRSVRDAQGMIIDFEWTLMNRKAEAVIGRTQTDLIGKRLLAEIPVIRELGLLDLYVQVVETGESLNHEQYYEDENARAWLHITAFKLDDGFVVTFDDITDQKLLLIDLEDKHAELERYFTLSLDLLCIADTDGHFIRLNTAWQDILGYPVEELVGRSFLDFIHPEDLKSTLSALELLSNQNQVLSFTNRYQHRDGSYRYIEWRSQPSDKMIYAVARDITKRRNIEEALRQSRAHLQMTLASVGAGTWEWNIANDHNIINERWAEIIGYTMQEVSPVNHQFWLNLVHPDDVQQAVALLQMHLQGQAEHYECEYRIKHKDGHWVWIADRGKVMEWTADGQPLVMFGTHTDITDQKQAQQREFEIAVEKARSELMSQFIQDAAHEFRTPLSIINSSAYMMSKVDSPEKRQEYAARIDAQVQRTTHLVDMLSKVVDLDRKRQPIYEAVNMTQVMQAICAHFQTTTDDHTIQYSASPLPVIQGDAADLYEAFKEIVDNARKHIAVDGHVKVRSRAGADHITIEIEDSGSGINPEALPHIFEAFWRQDAARTTPGFGLGLTIAQKIIQMHGGQIIVQSTLDEGSLFSVSLPIMPPQV